MNVGKHFVTNGGYWLLDMDNDGKNKLPTLK